MAKNVVRIGAPVLKDGIEVSLTGRGMCSALIALLLLVSPVIALPQDAQAATLTTATTYPSVAAVDTSFGSESWNNVNNVKVDDANSATTASSLNNGSKTFSNYIAASGFDFSAIPNDATIDGIELTVKRKASAANIVDAEVRLVSPTTGTTASKADTVTNWGTGSYGTVVYGNSSDKWGTTWTATDLKSANFKVLFAAKHDGSGGSAQPQVGSISIKVTYTEAVVVPGDTTAPIVTEVTPVVTPGNDDTPPYTFNTDEAGTIGYGGSCSGSTSAAVVGDNTIDLDVADGTIADCTITVTDASSNTSLPLLVTPFTVDATGPTVLITTGASSPTSMSSIEFQIQFSEEVADFSDLENDVSVTNATFMFTAESATLYTIEATPITDGDVTVSVGSNVAHDALGNGNSAALPVTVEYDTTGPGVAIIEPVDGSSTNDSRPLIDFTYTGDTASASCELDGDDFDCTGMTSFTPAEGEELEDGEHTFAITVVDALANETTAQVTFTVDTTAPTVDIDSSFSDPTNTSPIPVTVTFSEDVTGFEEGDVSVTNGSIDSGFGGSGTTYSFTVTPSAEGDVLIDIAAGAAEDLVGNDSEEADQFSIEYDTTAPTLTIDSPADGSTNGPDVTFSFTAESGASVECSLDEAPFGPCDTSSTHAVSGLSDGSHDFAVRAADEAGNSVIESIEFTVDATGPVVTEVTPVPTPTTNHIPVVVVNFSEESEVVFGGACTTSVTQYSAGEVSITFDELPAGTYSDCTIEATDEYGNTGSVLTLSAFEVESRGGGGGGGNNNNDNNDETTPADEPSLPDLGGFFNNLFGGGAGDNQGNAGDEGAAAGAGEEDVDGADGAGEQAALEGTPTEEDQTNLLANALSALGFDGANSWLLALIAALLAALGYGGWFAFNKFKK